jgi:mono/diheme cytochrome c family protein
LVVVVVRENSPGGGIVVNWKTPSLCLAIPGLGIAVAAACFAMGFLHGDGPAPAAAGDDYAQHVRPLLKKYCFECHSTKAHKGDLDLERFDSLAAVRKDLKPWQHLIEQLEVGEMPPKGKPQPTAAERKTILAWTHNLLATEARARAGDPGRVPLRRLSNTEYDCTVRDLTGVDLKPAREFPADGAGGEGFTNAAESLSDITPALLTRYLDAAKDIADHAVLLPDGVRFSAGKTRRDWTDESTARLRAFYAAFTADGRLAYQPYLLATVRHRAALAGGKTTLAEVAAQEKLNPKYLAALWQALTDKAPSDPLDRLRARWRAAGEKDVGPLAAEVDAWQQSLWKFEKIGSYRYGATTRQVANDPAAGDSQPIKLALKPAPGQNEVVLYLATRELGEAGKGARVVWQRPRFEGKGKPPLLLRDYPQFGAAFEVDHAAVFADTTRYLAAAAALANDRKLSVEKIAGENKLDADLLKRWVALLDIDALRKETVKAPPTVPAVALSLLEQKTPKNDKRPSINGWHRQGSDLPVLVTNAADAVQQIPGTVLPHRVAVHPTPKEFVAVAWKSPFSGEVKVDARVKHAHPSCGNGVAWWLEHRRAGKATILTEGALDLGGEANIPGRALQLEAGDVLVLAVDARDGNHFCDLTEINLTVTAAGKTPRVWDLAADVADTVQAGNPHADRHGNKDVWSFVYGPAKPAAKTPRVAAIPPNSVLAQWRAAMVDPARRAEADKLAARVQAVLTGARPAKESGPDRLLFDALADAEGTLLRGLDLTRFAWARPKGVTYGLPKDRFNDNGSLVAAADSVVEVRLPAALFRDREFVVEGKLDGAPGERVVLFDVATTPPGQGLRWNGKSPVVAAPTAAAFKRLVAGFTDFRRVFPWYLCFPNVVPTDEVVSLKMFHREDEPLERLFLDTERQRYIDRLWDEHRFISQQPVAENDYLPQFIGYVTQDQPKELLAYFESQRPVFKKRADAFVKDAIAAEPKHLAALVEFAGRAYRRPLEEKEKTDLLALYQKVRKKGAAHDEALRGVLTRVLVAPAFLFRIEKAPPGAKAGPIDDWELATRLSYFLWSSAPDQELRDRAAAGKLRDPQVLADQTRRMLKDDRLRALAIEFGTQWIHVRNFDGLKEKNEKLFPTFTPELRTTIYEESILFFLDLFQQDRAVTQVLDADYTFLNEALAKHYGIPGVSGPQWRRVEGVRKYGRGGILGLASVHARQSGASRTSPVLRGNWVVETLLGEKLPRPPANVPILPDEAGGADRGTTRQQVEKHVSNPNCAACHVRIDPYGFAFENFDAIGRWRVKEAGGLPVDARAKLRDGTEFDGIEGLRQHLLTKKQDVIVRLFCTRLLGYALGRATTLSDGPLIDEMVAELQKHDGRLSAAVLTIVRSPQFRMIRGREFED